VANGGRQSTPEWAKPSFWSGAIKGGEEEAALGRPRRIRHQKEKKTGGAPRFRIKNLREREHRTEDQNEGRGWIKVGKNSDDWDTWG